jgi:hypothetical protein
MNIHNSQFLPETWKHKKRGKREIKRIQERRGDKGREEKGREGAGGKREWHTWFAILFRKFSIALAVIIVLWTRTIPTPIPWKDKGEKEKGTKIEKEGKRGRGEWKDSDIHFSQFFPENPALHWQ